MPDRTPKEHFLPSLLDRLTDDDPTTAKEANDRRLFSQRQLRDSVLRDLTWLLNTTNFEAVDDLQRYPRVTRSVVNFGIPNLTGWTASSISADTIANGVQKAIQEFEPRILSRTLKVRAVISADQMNRNALGFEIQGLLWGTPAPSSILVRTEVDLETGHVQIQEFSSF